MQINLIVACKNVNNPKSGIAKKILSGAVVRAYRSGRDKFKRSILGSRSFRHLF